MKIFGFILVALAVVFFAGCQCPRRVADEIEREERPVDMVTPADPVTPVEDEPIIDPIVQPTVDPEVPTPFEEELEFVDPRTISEELAAIFRNIYFDFDRYDIREDARPRLEVVADYLKENPAVRILVEGHCDERGTREYNLVLGEQRALSTRRFLVGLGVAPERIFTVSYGKDMPADPASNEEAWARNRRAEFKVEK